MKQLLVLNLLLLVHQLQGKTYDEYQWLFVTQQHNLQEWKLKLQQLKKG
jgi:hypothetical protein